MFKRAFRRVITGVVALTSLGLAFHFVYLVVASQTRDTAQGKVLSTDIEERKGGRGATLFRPQVNYRYVVDGQVYHGHVVTPYEMDQEGSEDYARKLVHRFSPKRGCVVYYQPRRPADAILVVRPRGSTVFLFSFMGLIGAVALVYFIYPEYESKMRASRDTHRRGPTSG